MRFTLIPIIAVLATSVTASMSAAYDDTFNDTTGDIDLIEDDEINDDSDFWVQLVEDTVNGRRPAHKPGYRPEERFLGAILTFWSATSNSPVIQYNQPQQGCTCYSVTRNAERWSDYTGRMAGSTCQHRFYKAQGCEGAKINAQAQVGQGTCPAQTNSVEVCCESTGSSSGDGPKYYFHGDLHIDEGYHVYPVEPL